VIVNMTRVRVCFPLACHSGTVTRMIPSMFTGASVQLILSGSDYRKRKSPNRLKLKPDLVELNFWFDFV